VTVGRTAGRGGAALAAGAALVGCTAPVVVEPAPMASDPVCAFVLQAAPEELGALARRPTTSQSSRAWGAQEPIVLRCGVNPPGPTTQRCLRVTGDHGEVVDWVVREEDGTWTFVTYGRHPAVEVTIPRGAAPDAAGGAAPLAELAPAVSRTAVERSCL
jgi:hypothetical protein